MTKKHFEVKITHCKLVKFEVPAETEREAILEGLKAIAEAPELYLVVSAKEMPGNGFCRDHGL